MATIKDIAVACKTSRGTVDRVLNNRGHVSSELAEKIIKTAQQMNYSPNKAGKSLAARKKNFKIAYIICDNAGKNPFYAIVRQGIMQKSAELAEYGMAVDVFSCPGQGFKRQIQLMEACEKQGYDALAITPVNHPEVAVKLRQMTDKGIAVVTVNSDMEFSGRIAYVGSHYRNAGETAAGLMALLSNGAPKVGIVSGFSDVLCHTERVDAFCEHINIIAPETEILELVENNDDDALSYKETKMLLAKHSQINALYLTAAGVQGAARAVKESGRQKEITVVCFDALPDTVKLMNEGIISAVICQQPEYQGAKPLEILSDYLAFGSLPQVHNYCATDIRIKENCTLPV